MIWCRRWFGGEILVPQKKLFHRPSAYGIVQYEDRILMLTTWQNGRFCLPGGGIEPWETNAQALQRELTEEAGIQVEVGALVHFQEDFFYYDPTKDAWHGLLFYYNCMPLTVALIPDDEVKDEAAIKPRWINIDQLDEKNMQPQELWLLDYLCKQ